MNPTFIIAIISTILFIKIPCSQCSIAAKKCQEYGKLVFVENHSPVLSRNIKKLSTSECGIVSTPLIIGGTKVLPREFPHMALIGYGLNQNADLTWECGGSLISDLYILTAAHCMESRQSGPAQKVRLGSINVQSNNDPDLQIRNIYKRIPHPNFIHLSKENDIALLKLDSPVKFTAAVRPACLGLNRLEAGKKAWAIGFGKLQFEANQGSKNLMKVLLDVYDNKVCANVYSPKKKIVDSMLCAGYLTGGKDTCQGDSGGPLQIILNDPYCMYSIVGTTSFGKFCGYKNTAAVYSDVSKFIPWIEKIVWA